MTFISFSINLKLVVPTLKFFVTNLQLLKWWPSWLFQYKPSLVMKETLCIVSWVLAVSCDSCPFAWSSGFIHQNQLIKQKKKMFIKKSNGCKDFKKYSNKWELHANRHKNQMDVKIFKCMIFTLQKLGPHIEQYSILMDSSINGHDFALQGPIQIDTRVWRTWVLLTQYLSFMYSSINGHDFT